MATSTATTNSVSPAPRALVIGITGGIGGEVAQALLRRGWDVHALHRNPGSVALPPELQGRVRMIRGDAMSESDVVAAAVSIVPDDLGTHRVSGDDLQLRRRRPPETQRNLTATSSHPQRRHSR